MQLRRTQYPINIQDKNILTGVANLGTLIDIFFCGIYRARTSAIESALALFLPESELSSTFPTQKETDFIDY